MRKPYKNNIKSDKFISLMFSEGMNELYVVQSGDSLLEIAITNDLSLKELMLLNNISDQNIIKTGQKLTLQKSRDLYFIGDDNFIAITKYNRSHFYAKAVYDLSLEF